MAVAWVRLPIPPSVNAAFVSAGHSPVMRRTGEYKLWLRLVRETVRVNGFPLGARPYGLWLDLPKLMKGDIDNRVKPVSDILGSKETGYELSMVEDDRLMDALYVERTDAVPKGECLATVVTMDAWYSYMSLRLF